MQRMECFYVSYKSYIGHKASYKSYIGGRDATGLRFSFGVYNVNIADFTQISVIHGKLAFSVNTNKLILSETFLYT